MRRSLEPATTDEQAIEHMNTKTPDSCGTSLARRASLLVPLLLALAAIAPSSVLAQAWPSKPVRIIVPFPPGGASDPMARIVAQKLSEKLGQPFVVENKAGAGTTIGTAEVAKAPADGYTLLLAPAPFVITQYVYPKLPYDGKKDFTPIGLIQTTPTVIVVNPKLGVRTPAEFLQLVRSKPGKITYGTPGMGTLPHLIGELLNQEAGVKMVHVPYKGGGPALTDLLAGTIDMSIMTPLVRNMVDSGKLVAIGTTSLHRTPSTPEWPTLAETAVPGFEALAWFGLVARSGTPPEILKKLSTALQEALQDPAVRHQIAESGDVPKGSVEEFTQLLNREHVRWERTVRQAGIKPE
jgi:tripartite-type tricarboxylate transporter receptor subunit TctC